MSLSKFQLKQAVDELLTAQDWSRWIATQLNKYPVYFGHGTVSAWDEAGALVIQTLDLPHEYLEVIGDCRLTTAERELLAQRVEMRINERKPLPYITQKSYFCGLEFYVDERVLIPRSPIAELIQQRFQPWLGEQTISSILDLCCGSACIGIACAQMFPEAAIDDADISEDALAVARINIDNYQLADQVQAIQSDGLKMLVGKNYDLIVCNPPYVDSADMASLPLEYRHEPELALAAGADGLDFVRELLLVAHQHLTPKGLLICEVGNSIEHMFQQYAEVPFTWLSFEHSDDGVFLISREDLLQYCAKVTE